MPEAALTHEVSWEGEPRGSAEKATWGRLSIRVDGEHLWGAQGAVADSGVRWTWVDLLEHLAEVWPWLIWEEGWPAGPLVGDPRSFLSDSRRWLEQLGPREAAEQEEAMYEFRYRHDLALAIGGKILPQLWIVREGRNAWVAGHTVSALISHQQVAEGLVSLADEIAGRLRGLDDERSKSAVEAWDHRLDIGTSWAAAISVGVGENALAELANGDVASTFEIDPAMPADAFEPNELLAAARMAVPSTSSSVVRIIVAAMKSIPPRATPALNQLSRAAEEQLAAEAGDSLKPATVGYRLARWLREALGVCRDDRVEPAALLEGWGVFVGQLAAPDDGIEAVACWGRAHGPAILVSSEGRHSREEAGRRATLAHEICHLLVDRNAALPLAEVFGGHVFRSVEQRAGAFAAEMLIPGDVAGSAFRDTSEPRQVLDSLAAAYGASREIVAWQAYNSGHGMSWDTFCVLRSQVTHPERFLWSVASKTR